MLVQRPWGGKEEGLSTEGGTSLWFYEAETPRHWEAT